MLPVKLFSQTYGSIGAGTYTGAQFLAAAQNNGIILNSNIRVSSTIVIPNGTDLTIDLNGYVLAGQFASTSSDTFVINVQSGGKLTIIDSQPTLGHAGHLDDNGIFVWPRNESRPLVSVPGGLICNTQRSGKNTKGISVEGTCIIERAKIMGCYSNDIGAAVTITSSGRFTMNAGEIRYNYTKGGAENRAGAIYGEPSHSNQGGRITLSNTTVSDNTSLLSGGAICGYIVSLDNCIIENNTATNGGAVCVRKSDDSLYDASLIINSSTIRNNKASTHGGGIYGEAGSLVEISGSTTIEGNSAGSYGGGIHATNLKINGTAGNMVTIQKNKARIGGGISATTSCDIDYCTIKSNYAAVNGGGLYSTAPSVVSNSLIDGNRAMTSEIKGEEKTNSGRGGGFFFHGKSSSVLGSGPSSELRNTIVTNNACMYYGGGGQVDSGAILEMTDGSQINNNISVLHGAGGLHVTGLASFIFTDGTISNNISHSVGGGIHSSYGCRLDLDGGTISGNVVYGRGGGIHVNVGGDIKLNGTNITGNKAYIGYDYRYSTVVENSDGTYSWTGPFYEGGQTKSTGYGGGVVVDAGTCTMEGGTLSENYAQVGGGGIALIMINMASGDRFNLNKIVNFTLNNGTVYKNTSDGNGAGIYLMKNMMSKDVVDNLPESEKIKDSNGNVLYKNGSPQIIINKGSITENIAQGNGGGAYQDDGTEFFINSNDVTVSRNKAAVSGGAVYISKGTATIRGGSIESNSASTDGGALYVNGNVTITAGSLLNNEATGNGGALYVNTGNVNMNNLQMDNNTAGKDGGGLHLNDGELSIGDSNNNSISDNKAYNGGGVCIANGTLVIKKCEISDNKATVYGGGIYVVNEESSLKTITCTGGTLLRNEATSGGGICAIGNINLTTAATLEMNSATNGGGIYMADGVKMSFGEGLIRMNKATGENPAGTATAYHCTDANIKGVGGGIFMAGSEGSPTSLEFTSQTEMGIYNNDASFAASDIFANGNNTSVTLPNISNMQLRDFEVAGNQLYWVEDYVTGDTMYDDYGTKKTASGIRYQEALYSKSLNNQLGLIADTDPVTKYACIVLGYDLVFVTLIKKGLLAEDDVTFKMSSNTNLDPSEEPDFKQYCEVLFTGTGQDVEKIVGLPSGEWKIEESLWNWKYETPTYAPADGLNDRGNIEINRTTNRTIIITNTSKDLDVVEDQAIKVNRMGRKPVTL